MVERDGEEVSLPTVCGICPGGCGVLATVKDGRLTKVGPLPGHPQGMLCLRGRHGPAVVHSPRRLIRVLKRSGPVGRFAFTEYTWDGALDEIAAKLLEIKEKWGAQALASFSGRGGFEQCVREFFAACTDTVSNGVFFPLGSPNAAGSGSICQVAYALLASMPTFGMPMALVEPDVENAGLIVVWGANPATDSPPVLLPRILQARARGARLVAIDHMRSDMARMADEWVGIRSGTDGALALGMINVIIDEQIHDREFVAKWTVGFAELAEYVARFTPERVEQLTWVPAETVRRLARMIAGAKGAALHGHTGLEYSNSGVQNIRAVFVLWAITGNLDVPGGLLLNKVIERTGRISKIRPPKDIPAVGADKYPYFYELTKSAHMMELPRAVLEGKPYPVKALVVHGSSILTSLPQPDLWQKVFEKLDLLVVIDRFLTDDARYAHYVLPATTYYENHALQRYRGWVQLRTPAIQPVGESRQDFFIFTELARRLGYGHLFPQNQEELWDWAFSQRPDLLARLKEHGEGLPLPGAQAGYRKYETGGLRPDGRPGFNTPSGKVEIASSILAKHGYDALPVYSVPTEGPESTPELMAKYPLILNTGARIQSTFRSQHLNIPDLARYQPEPRVLINPADARRRGIADGDDVLVVSARGAVPYKAEVTADVLPGQVEANMGGGGPGQAEHWEKCNVNVLTDHENRDPISGFPVYKALLCDVKKVNGDL